MSSKNIRIQMTLRLNPYFFITTIYLVSLYLKIRIISNFLLIQKMEPLLYLFNPLKKHDI